MSELYPDQSSLEDVFLDLNSPEPEDSSNLDDDATLLSVEEVGT